MSLPADPHTVFVIIPYYNERTVIAEVLRTLEPGGYQVVLVDDGSKNAPGPELKGLKPVYLVRHKVNLGQGAALQTGIDLALLKGATHLVTFDADGQHSAADLPSLLAPLFNNEADITLASRFIRKGSHNASRGKQVVLNAARWVNYLFTGLYLTDAHNGLRAMTRPVAQQLRFRENRMAHATEILLEIRKHKIRYKEVPASVFYTEYSKKKGQSVFNSIRIFFDLVLHKLFE
jgi:Glycosyltransferases involved in cell wall biogenesis